MADSKFPDLSKIEMPLTARDTFPVVNGSTNLKTSPSDLQSSTVWMADQSSTPPIPPTGVKVYASNKANRRRLSWVGPSGVDNSMQSFLGTNKIGYWSATGTSTSGWNASPPGVFLLNMGNVTSGTLGSRAPALTNLFTSTRRMGYTIATAGTEAGWQHGALQFSRRWGFDFIARFGLTTWGSGSFRGYSVGLSNSITPFTSGGGITSSTSVASICYRHDIGSPGTNGLFSSNGSSSWGWIGGNSLNFLYPVDRFPMTPNTTLYEVRFFCKPNDTVLYSRIENLSNGEYAEFTTTDGQLPGMDVLLNPSFATYGGATGTSIDLVSVYIETDY